LPRMSGVATYAVLQYSGHKFAGWQLQDRARTAQGEFEAVLQRLIGTRVVTHAAGRTDAGVHALGQVVSFQFPSKWDPAELLRALRALVPHDMWVVEVGRAPPGFDARRHATSRHYRYVIGCDAASFSPFRSPFEWALGLALDAGALKQAAKPIIGEHDFRAFAIKGAEKPHYRCTVTTAEWRERDDAPGFIFEIKANRFLHRMVRLLVGTMVDAGRGRRAAEDIAGLLEVTTNHDTSPPAPPQGLYFVGAHYPRIDEVTDQ
jgi:tRNA pseudouridine38-40 synthase